MNALRSRHLPLLALLAFSLLLPAAHAQVTKPDIPVWIKIEGSIFGDEFDGRSRMVLRVYNRETNGTLLYEDVGTVDIKDGFYATYLGDDTTQGDLMRALASGEAYLDVTVNGTTLTPRERMVTVPYAVLAHAVVREGITEDMVQAKAIVAKHLGDASITADKLAPGIITTDKIAPSAVSLDKLADTPWVVGGNRKGPNGQIMILGTLDPQALDLIVGGKRALRAQPHPVSPGVITGHQANKILNGVGGATVGGGGSERFPNQIGGDFGTVGGGEGNQATGPHTTVAGGWDNHAGGQRTAIGGGRENRADRAASTIAGGYSNVASQTYATIGGGFGNLSEGFGTTIAGGFQNKAGETVATIGGGQDNIAAGPASTIGGGFDNQTSAYGATVAGGQGNQAAGPFSTIGGGTNNITEGVNATVIGGANNQAIGDYSTAGGLNAIAANRGATVFADSQPGNFTSTKDDSFVIRARGGVGIGTPNPLSPLHVVGEARADVVRAGAFVGDGSNLTGIKATPGPASINESHLAPGSVSARQIAPGAITADKLAPGAVAKALPIGSIDANHLAPGVIPTFPEIPTLPKNLLTSDSILNGQVTGTPNELVIRPGSITADQFAPGALPSTTIPDASITAAKLAPGVIPTIPVIPPLPDNLLTRETKFDGQVAGFSEALVIRPGSITADQLAPGVIPAIPDIPKLPDNLLNAKSPAGGQLIGNLNNLFIRPGSVTAEQLAPGLIPEIPDTTIQPGSITADKLAPGVIPATPEIPALPDNLLTDQSAAGGQLIGSLASLFLKPGSVTAEQLAPGVIPEIPDTTIQPGSITADKLAPGVIPRIPEIPPLPDNLLTDKSAAGGQLIGSLGSLFIKPGSVTAEQLAPGVIPEIPAFPDTTIQPGSITADKLARGSITADKLAPGVFPKIPAAPKLPDNLLTTRTAVGGQFIGTVDNMFIRPGSITADQFAKGVLPAPKGLVIPPGSITADKLAPGVLRAVGAVSGDTRNGASGSRSSIGGGQGNQAAGRLATVSGGSRNTATGLAASVPGGADNQASGEYSFAAGHGAVAAHNGSFVWSDSKMNSFSSTAPDQVLFKTKAFGIGTASPHSALTVAGTVAPAQPGAGDLGTASHPWNTLHANTLAAGANFALTGPDGNPALAIRHTPESPNVVLGFHGNSVGEETKGAIIMGGGRKGEPNTVTANYGTIGGGLNNRVAGFNTTIAGGQSNQAGGGITTIGGGYQNKASGRISTIAGGADNQASGDFVTVGGGTDNKATGDSSTVSGGAQNTASASFASVLGGGGNKALGDFSTVLGGQGNLAAGKHAIAAGKNAEARHDGVVIFADPSGQPIASSGENQFIVRAAGGVTFLTSPDNSAGTQLPPGSGAFASLSDRNAKRDFHPVDPSSVLAALDRVPIYNYAYKTQDEAVRHIGPTAQDFSAAFRVGESNTHITTIDADGVALAAIQALSKQVKAKDSRIQTLELQLELMQRQMQLMNSRLDAIAE